MIHKPKKRPKDLIGCFEKPLVKSSFNSPPGQRLRSGLTAVRMNVSRCGGSIAVWSSVLSVCECTTMYLHQKQDPWNSIISGAVSGGLMFVRQGVGPFVTGTVFGGFLVALAQGGMIMLTKSLNAKQLPHEAPLAQGRKKVGTTLSWFDATDKEVLESFDSPVPPML